MLNSTTLPSLLLVCMLTTVGCDKAETPKTSKNPAPAAATAAKPGTKSAAEPAKKPAPKVEAKKAVTTPPSKAVAVKKAPAAPAKADEPALDCAGKDWQRCFARVAGMKDDKDQAERAKTLVAICESEARKTASVASQDACALAGTHFLEGRGVDKDLAKAKTLYTRGCDLKSPNGCAALAAGSAKGTLGSVDHAAAVKALEKGCALGRKTMCEALPTAKLMAAAGPPSGWQAACAAKNGKACVALGRALLKGTDGQTQNVEAAIGALEQGCNAKESKGCHLAGMELGKQDKFRKSRKLFKKGCALEHGESCFMKGSSAMPGSKKWRAFHAKVCAMKSAKACFAMGTIYKSGIGLKGGKDPALAKEWYGKACALGMRAGCGHSN